MLRVHTGLATARSSSKLVGWAVLFRTSGRGTVTVEPAEHLLAVQLEADVGQVRDHLVGEVAAQTLGERHASGGVLEDRARQLARTDPAAAPCEGRHRILASVGERAP